MRKRQPAHLKEVPIAVFACLGRGLEALWAIPVWMIAPLVLLVFVGLHGSTLQLIFGSSLPPYRRVESLLSEHSHLQHARPRWDELFDGGPEGSPCIIDSNTLTILTAANYTDGEGVRCKMRTTSRISYESASIALSV